MEAVWQPVSASGFDGIQELLTHAGGAHLKN
jgi:hypothetical protein